MIQPVQKTARLQPSEDCLVQLTFQPAIEIPSSSEVHFQRQALQVLTVFLQKILLFLFRQLRPEPGPVCPPEDNLQIRVRERSIENYIISGQPNCPAHCCCPYQQLLSKV